MKQFKLYIIIITLFLTSCGTLKEGFTNQKKNNSDEFLVEKKSPLVMPPDYNDLPIPTEQNLDDKDDNEIKLLISKNENDSIENSKIEKNQSFEDSLLEKIKDN